MVPYYSEAGIEIYHGDCRDVLPFLASSATDCVANSPETAGDRALPPIADLMLTDPPYGIALDTRYSRRTSEDIQGRDYQQVVGDSEPMDFEFLFGSSLTYVAVIWGANNWPQQIPFRPQRDGWICWDKRLNERADKILGSPFELAVVLGRRCYQIIRLQHCGVKNADGDKAGRFHPTQKPTLLMRIIMIQMGGRSVVDPFMGSGTTLRAAKDLGRKAIGIEIEEKYCEIAANRLRQEVLAFA